MKGPEYGIKRGHGWQTLTVPVPPSLNRKLIPIQRTDGSLGMTKTKAIRDYEASIAQLVSFLRPVNAGDVVVAIAWYRANPKEGDLDNRLKIILDLLQGRAYANDRQIRQLTVERFDSEPDRPRFVLTVEIPDYARP